MIWYNKNASTGTPGLLSVVGQKTQQRLLSKLQNGFFRL